MKILLAIVNYNTAQLISHLLFSLFRFMSAKARSNMDILIIDNASTDESRDILLAFQQVGMIRTILNDRQLYHGPALNQAVDVAVMEKYDYLWTMDSDVVVIREEIVYDAIEFMVKTNAAIIGQEYLTMRMDNVPHISCMVFDMARCKPKFGHSGNPARKICAEAEPILNFPFRREYYILHMGGGTRAMIKATNDQGNEFFAVRGSLSAWPDGELPSQIYEQFKQIYQSEVPTPDHLLEACHRPATLQLNLPNIHDQAVGLYLDLMKRILANTIYQDPGHFRIGAADTYRFKYRRTGRDCPSVAHTAIGYSGLDNIQFCVENVIKNNVSGDLIETGVWRGGATIFMRAILKAHGITDRTVWVADSFEGLPKPNESKYPQDSGCELYNCKALAVSLKEVRANFERYGLLDRQVRFLKGWFRDTLPGAAISRLAVLRLDGDMYESTMDALVSLYSKLSVGGYVIIDDYALRACRSAVHDFREQFGIVNKMIKIDQTRVYWQRGA